MTMVLVVDDEPIVREVVVSCLKREGYRSRPAAATAHVSCRLIATQQRDGLGGEPLAAPSEPQPVRRRRADRDAVDLHAHPSG
jgi:CheY-like chemotaxis protein